MAAVLAEIWRHPIKGVGRERLARVRLRPGQALPFDRHWAVAHEAARIGADEQGWAPCPNFVIGARAPALQAIEATLDEATRRVTLRHPERPAITLCPDVPADADRLLAWLAPLVPEGRARPAFLRALPGRGNTDTDYPSISIAGLGSHRAVEQAAGFPLSPLRWRVNLLIEGTAPWEEFEWVGRRLRIGPVVLAVRERIQRCRATMANPETGAIDLDTLALLEERWGHRDFGVYAEVEQGGEIHEGCRVELLP